MLYKWKETLYKSCQLYIFYTTLGIETHNNYAIVDINYSHYAHNYKI